MAAVELRVRKDELGNTGLTLGPSRSKEIMVDGGDGILLAHDLIEHQNGPAAIGTIIDELQALGAIMYVRGWSGMLGRFPHIRYTPEEQIAGELPRLFDYVQWGAKPDFTVPVTQVCDADDSFNVIMERASRDYTRHTDSLDTQEWLKLLRDFKNLVMPYMRIGYRKAHRRFRTRVQAHRQFWSIADAIHTLCEREELFEGQRFSLTWGKGVAKIREIE